MNAAVVWGLLSALGYGATDFAARFSGQMAGVWRTMLYGQSAALLVATAWLLFNREAWVNAATTARPRPGLRRSAPPWSYSARPRCSIAESDNRSIGREAALWGW